jgi:segregation and condensation protein B
MDEEKQDASVAEQPADELLAQAAAASSELSPEKDSAASEEMSAGERVAGEKPESTSQDEAAQSAGQADVDAFLLTAEQPATAAQADAATLKALIEAVVYVLPEPLPAAQIAAALNQPLERVQAGLKELMEDTARPDRGVFVREVAGGYQLATKPEHHEAIRNFVKNLKQPLKLSTAALETLAVIAYKQPVTAPEILEIRGVQGVGVLKTLLDRKLITTAGRKNVLGKPILYKTTKEFLTQFGLKEVSELPTLKEFEEIRRQSFAEDDEAPPQPAPVAAPLVRADVANEPEPAGAAQPIEKPEAGPEAAPEAEAEPAPEASAEASPEVGGIALGVDVTTPEPQPAPAAQESSTENDG